MENDPYIDKWFRMRNAARVCIDRHMESILDSLKKGESPNDDDIVKIGHWSSIYLVAEKVLKI